MIFALGRAEAVAPFEPNVASAAQGDKAAAQPFGDRPRHPIVKITLVSAITANDIVASLRDSIFLVFIIRAGAQGGGGYQFAGHLVALNGGRLLHHHTLQ